MIERIVADAGPAPYAKHEARAAKLVARAEQTQDPEIFEAVIREFPNSTALPRALLARGAVLIEAGELDTAVASLRRVISDHPRHVAAATAIALLARAYRLEGSFGAASAALAHVPRDKTLEIDGERTSSEAFVAAEQAALPSAPAGTAASEALAPDLADVGFVEAGGGRRSGGRELELTTERGDAGRQATAPVAVMLHGRSLAVIDLEAAKLAWEAKVPDGVDRGAFAGGNLVLAMTPLLSAYDAKTGDRIWSRDVGGLVRELEISGGLLFAVVQERQSLTGTSVLMAFDPYTGRRLWAYDLGPENPRRLRGWRGRILLERTRWDARQSVARLMVVDGFFGTLEQQMTIPVQVEAYPVVAGDVFVVAYRKREGSGYQRQLKAYDLVRGVERWRRNLPMATPISALLTDGEQLVILDRDGHVRTFAAAGGEELGVTKLAIGGDEDTVRPFMQSGILLDETSITFLPSVRRPNTPSVMSFDRATGRMLWERPFPKGAELTSARLMPSAGTLGVFVSYRRQSVPHVLVRVLDRATGELLQEVEPEGIAQPRWIPTAQAGYGSVVVFGKPGASILGSAAASKR